MRKIAHIFVCFSESLNFTHHASVVRDWLHSCFCIQPRLGRICKISSDIRLTNKTSMHIGLLEFLTNSFRYQIDSRESIKFAELGEGKGVSDLEMCMDYFCFPSQTAQPSELISQCSLPKTFFQQQISVQVDMSFETSEWKYLNFYNFFLHGEKNPYTILNLGQLYNRNLQKSRVVFSFLKGK